MTSTLHEPYLQQLQSLELQMSTLLSARGGEVWLGPNLPLSLSMRTDGTMNVKRMSLCEQIAPQLPPVASLFTTLLWSGTLRGFGEGKDGLTDGRTRALILFHGLLQAFLDPGVFRYALPTTLRSEFGNGLLLIKQRASLLRKLLCVDVESGESLWPTVSRLVSEAAKGRISVDMNALTCALYQHFQSRVAPTVARSFAGGCATLLEQLNGGGGVGQLPVVCQQVVANFDSFVTFDHECAGPEVGVGTSFAVSFRDCQSAVVVDELDGGGLQNLIILRPLNGWCGVEVGDGTSSDDDGSSSDEMVVEGSTGLGDHEAHYKQFIRCLAVVAKCGVRAVLTSATLPNWWSPPRGGPSAADGRASQSTVSLTLPNRATGATVEYSLDVIHSLDREDLQSLAARLSDTGSRFDTLDVTPRSTHHDIGEALLRPMGNVFRMAPFASMVSTGHRRGSDQQYLSIMGVRGASSTTPLPFLRIPVASCRLIRAWKPLLRSGFRLAELGLNEGWVAGGGWHACALSNLLRSPSRCGLQGDGPLVVEKRALLQLLSELLLRLPVALCPSEAMRRELIIRCSSECAEDVWGVLLDSDHTGLASHEDLLRAGVVDACGDLERILHAVFVGLGAVLRVDTVIHEGAVLV